MTKLEAKSRISKLRDEINRHRHAYHVLDQATISEAALDSLKHELYTLEQQFPELITADSPTQRVGGKPLAKFGKIKHVSPMLSIEDVFTFDEFKEWDERIGKLLGGKSFEMFAMVKLDGLAVELIYRDGLLESASTRGDGIIGEDITQNVKTIEAIPLSIDERSNVVVRGEIYFPVKEFERLNKSLEKAGEPVFANPRNAAAGAVRQLDPTITASRKLSFFAWDIVSDNGQKTHQEEIELLMSWGFPVEPNGQQITSIESVDAFWKGMQKKRAKMNYWIDGTVIRLNENKLFADLGVVGKTPRGLIAWKFPAEETTTVVEDVEWFVGRTGALTPVAVVRPTFVAGTTVKHASLHNADEIERLDVRIGDTIVLYKAGDIIPKVKEVLKNLRPKNAKQIHPPTTCPVCGSPVERKEGEVAYLCTNKRCYAQDEANILHAARAFGIDGIGPSTIALLLDHKIVQSPPEIFTLKVEDLLELERFADVSANKLVDEIQSKKEITLDRFLVGLGIRHVGEETGLLLAEQFGSLQKLMAASVEQLSEVEGVGEIVGKSVAEFFADKHNREIIDAYQNNGVKIQTIKAREKGPLSGKSYVLTGTLASMERELAKQKIRELGGDIVESVSKKTTGVIVGENPGSKFDKAKKLSVPTLTEADFLRMIGK